MQGFFYHLIFSWDLHASMMINANPHEIQKFSDLAHRWWDPHAECKPLHALNPVRLGWICQHSEVAGKKIVDVGCGGGILSESMAKLGAQVKGIDLSNEVLQVAELHSLETGISVDYEVLSAEALALREGTSYDIVTCMEMLEHVPDPAATVVACAKLVKPGGSVFFSTLNRTAKAYVSAIIAAEYIAQLLPQGTHEYAQFIRPSELAGFARTAGLIVREMVGVTYHPLSQTFSLSGDVTINYMLMCIRPQ
jgi:2-polyprenyl-6-hydroxyphenyl methylase/3-demethylubiquinone-9 3-methyltransferase